MIHTTTRTQSNLMMCHTDALSSINLKILIAITKKKTLPLESSGKTKTNKKCHTAHSCQRATFKWETFTTSLFATVTHIRTSKQAASAASSTSWSRSFFPRNRASTVRQVHSKIYCDTLGKKLELYSEGRRAATVGKLIKREKTSPVLIRFAGELSFLGSVSKGVFFEFWTKKNNEEIKQTTIAFFPVVPTALHRADRPLAPRWGIPGEALLQTTVTQTELE